MEGRNVNLEEDKGAFPSGSDGEKKFLSSRIETPKDIASRAVRPRDAYRPDYLRGVSDTIDFLFNFLLDREEIHPILVPLPVVAMIYGRPGSGKNTVMHLTNQTDGKRIFLDTAFSVVKDFRLHHSNVKSFTSWAEEAIKLLHIMNRPEPHASAYRYEHEPRGPASLLIFIQDVHIFNYIVSPEPLDAFVQLLMTVRSMMYERRGDVRVVLTCGESPGTFNRYILDLIDRKHFIGLPDNFERTEIIIDLINAFKDLCKENKRLQNVMFSIDTGEDVMEEADADHIINKIALASAGTTPREITAFMRRAFVACSTPDEFGHTDFNEDLIEKLLYKVEDGSSICHYNPAEHNKTILDYAGLDPESTAKNSTMNTLILGEKNKIINLMDKQREEEEKRNELQEQRVGGRAKRHRTEEQEEERKTKQKTLKEQSEIREKVLRNAARRKRTEQYNNGFK